MLSLHRTSGSTYRNALLQCFELLRHICHLAFSLKQQQAPLRCEERDAPCLPGRPSTTGVRRKSLLPWRRPTSFSLWLRVSTLFSSSAMAVLMVAILFYRKKKGGGTT